MISLPRLWQGFYQAWIKLAYVLGWVNTRIILTIFYLVMFVPLGLIMRLLGKKLLDQSFHSGPTYWVKRDSTFRKDSYLKPY